MKRPGPDECDAVWDRESCQAGAAVEGTIADALHPISDRDAGQRSAACECAPPDRGNAGERNAGESGTSAECVLPNRSDAVGNRDARQPAGGPKCAICDSNDALRDYMMTRFCRRVGVECEESRHIRHIPGVKHPVHATECRVKGIYCDRHQARTAPECIRADASDAFRDRKAGQARAACERTPLNPADAVRDRDADQAGAREERTLPDAVDAAADRDAGQPRAIRKRALADGADAVGDGDAGQARAACERTPLNGGDAVRDRDAGQTFTPRKRPLSDASDTVADRDAGQPRTIRKRSLADGADAVGNRHVGEAAARVERMVSDLRDTVGDLNAGQSRAASERTPLNRDDRQSFDAFRDDHITARPAVTSDGNRAVIDGVIELGLRLGRQNQEQEERQQTAKVTCGCSSGHFPRAGCSS